jgi:hypothetical protein
MNVNTMDNGDITVEHFIDEQNSNINNQEIENSIQNQSNSEKAVKIINKVKKGPMNPTPLYIFFLFLSFIINE